MKSSNALFKVAYNKTFLKYLVFAAILSCQLIASSSALASLPKNGSIAVLAMGPSDQHAVSVAAILTRELIANGYKVVDPDTLAAIRRNKAARLALDGDVDAIMKLTKQYGFSTMITAQLKAGRPVVNEFQLYTGTSSIAIMVMSSGGQMIYADTVMGKQVGYTPDEAAQKSIEAAAKSAVKKMME
jgi:PAS domain-containing protein